jgi:hypothetical protein
MNQKRKCKHFLLGPCQRKAECEYSHDISNCPNHQPSSSTSGSLCQDTGCTSRHPRLCLHFVNSQCHFGTKCELYHPKKVSTSQPHSLVMKLQLKMEIMMVEITHLQEVKNLKYKSELILPTTDDDPSYEKFQPPDPPPDSISLPDIDVHAPRTNDYGEMETEVSVSYNCIVCSIRYSYDKLSPDILSIMQRHINTAAKRQSFLQKLIEEGKTRPKCATCQLFADHPARVLIKALMVI